jgi:hypothetical protein
MVLKAQIGGYAIGRVFMDAGSGINLICTVHGSTPLRISHVKNPRANGVITIKGNFEVSDTRDKEFNKMAQTFGRIAEYARLKRETDHNVLRDVG